MLSAMGPRIRAILTLSLLALAALISACGDDNPEKPSGPTLSFALQPAVPLGSIPWRTIATGDFDHDGNADLATCSSESSLIYVALGHGDGTFQIPRRVPVAGADVTAGDFDHDGNLDLAAGRLVQGTAFLYGRGDGDFDLVSLGVPIMDQRTPSAGDFNGDGIDDYVGQCLDSVAVVLGNSGRVHTRVVSYLPPRAGVYGEGVATDIDGDGRADYAVGNWSSANHVSVYYGNGDGTFQAQATPSDAGWDLGVCSIRRLGGGVGRDLAIAHNIGETAGVVRRVTGAFVPEATYPAGPSPTDVGAADFNMDGVEDLVVASYDNNSAAILLGRTDGTFGSAVHFNIGSSPQCLAVADVNNDGRPDLAVVGIRAFYILLNTSKPPRRPQ
jgi:hypothetical protein